MVSAPGSLVSKMTIIRAGSGHHRQIWRAVSQLFSTVYVMSQDILNIFSINQLVEYYKSSILLS